MEDYPRNLKEFDVRFRSEEACREYLLQLRWRYRIVHPELRKAGGKPQSIGSW